MYLVRDTVQSGGGGGREGERWDEGRDGGKRRGGKSKGLILDFRSAVQKFLAQTRACANSGSMHQFEQQT